MGILAVILVGQVLFCSLCVANLAFDHFKRNYDVDGMIPTEGTLDFPDKAGRNLATCTGSCSKQPSCKGVFFSSVQSLCNGSTERYFDTLDMVASTGTVFFAKPECAVYGSDFKVYFLQSLDMDSTEEWSSHSYPDPCKAYCASQSWCRGFDHNFIARTCLFKNESAAANSEHLAFNLFTFHYSRKCASLL